MGQLAAFAPELITAFGDVGAGVGAGLTAPTPYQPKQAYGGNVSPQNTLSQIQELLNQIAPGLIQHAEAPVSLPDAVVNPLPDVGLYEGHGPTDPGALAHPGSTPSLNLAPDPGAPNPTGAPVPFAGGGVGNPPDYKTPQRQSFSAPMPSGNQSTPAQTPTQAAIALLRHAASMPMAA